jgi:hypothetical protein
VVGLGVDPAVKPFFVTNERMKTNAEVVRILKGFYDTNIQALQGVMDKLPEALRGDLAKLKDTLNEQLSKLPPIEQVPAAQDAAWALNSFVDSVSRINEFATRLMERLNGMATELKTRTSEYNGLQEQVTKGDLLPKDKVNELCTLAREDERKKLLPDIIALRKQAVELAGLPMPGEEILGGTNEAFTASVAEAKANVKTLEGKGLKLKGRGSKLVEELAWKNATEFAGRMSLYEDLIGGAANGKPVEPLLGGGGAGEDLAGRASRAQEERKTERRLAFC